MKKNILFFILFLTTSLPVCSQTLLSGGVELEWPLLNQEEGVKVINNLREKLFEDVTYKLDKKEFKKKYEKNWDDPQKAENRYALKKKWKKLGDKTLAGFYLMNKLLYMYGVKYEKDKYNVYYYDALGNLRYVDILDKPHDEYPHISYQYNVKGKLEGVVYNISEYDQYIYNEKGKFKGRWYKEKLYDKKAKIIMTRR